MNFKSIAFLFACNFIFSLCAQSNLTPVLKATFEADVARWKQQENNKWVYYFNRVQFDDLNQDGQIDAVVDYTSDLPVGEQGSRTYSDNLAVYLQKEGKFTLVDKISRYNQVFDTVKNGYIYTHTYLWNSSDAMCCPSLHFPYKDYLQGDTLVGGADSSHPKTDIFIKIKEKVQGEKLLFAELKAEKQFSGTIISNKWENNLQIFAKEGLISERLDNSNIPDSLFAAFYFELGFGFERYTYLFCLAKTINPKKYIGYLSAFISTTGELVDSYEFAHPVILSKDRTKAKDRTKDEEPDFWEMSVQLEYSKYNMAEPFVLIKSISAAGSNFEQLTLLEKKVFVGFD